MVEREKSWGLLMDKNTLLRDLKRHVEDKFRESKIWLFPKGDSKIAVNYFETNLGKRVKGFWGTGEKPNSDEVIMIIAERPSVGRGKKPKEFDKTIAHFYEFLEENKLYNSHLTDFIKTRAKVDYDLKKPQKLKFYEGEFSQHLPILKKEIGIIKPTKIIVMGEKTFLWVAICKSFLKLRNVRLILVPHYANRFKKKEEFEKEFLTSSLN